MKQDVSTHHGNGCCCPTCRGLRPFEQPLFAAGQVLNAADLSSLQTYVKGKNRLHNRYLHGWGVVCGLEVVCDDCEGSVTIRSGYAIDPCGEDVVVAQDTRFDVVKAIRECCDSRKSKTGDCDPWAPPPDPGCKDIETHWCISLKYKEVEASYVRALATSMPGPAQSCGCGGGKSAGGCGCGGKSKSAGGCGCGGKSKSGGDCGCGCGGAKSQGVAAKGLQWGSSATALTSNNNCAPRRLLECFDVGIAESPHGCQPTLFERRPGDDRQLDYAASVLKTLIPDDSLLGRIVACLAAKIQPLAALDQRQTAILIALFAGATPPVPAAEIHAAVVRFRKIVMDLLADDDNPVRCQMRVVAGTIILPAPTVEEEREQKHYTEQAREALRDLLAVWLQLMIDCICHAFIPQCDDDPCDDRVEVACVTVKGDKILRICNHSCRRYAGAFPSTFYWMSLVPVLPLIGKLLAWLCCRPELLRRNSPLVNDLMPALDAIDPTGRLRQAIVGNNFALPKLYIERLAKTVDPRSFAGRLLGSLYHGLIAAGEAGGSVKGARDRFKAADISVEEREVDEAEADRLIGAMLRHPLVQPGDSVVVHKRGDRVVAVTPATTAPANAELDSLRTELKQLRNEVRALKRHK
jgi:hypothetical protein